MITLTKTETIFFPDQDHLTDYLQALRASENMAPDVETSIRLNGYHSRPTAVSGAPAVETYVTANLPQLSVGPAR